MLLKGEADTLPIPGDTWYFCVISTALTGYPATVLSFDENCKPRPGGYRQVAGGIESLHHFPDRC